MSHCLAQFLKSVVSHPKIPKIKDLSEWLVTICFRHLHNFQIKMMAWVVAGMEMKSSKLKRFLGPILDRRRKHDFLA